MKCPICDVLTPPGDGMCYDCYRDGILWAAKQAKRELQSKLESSCSNQMAKYLSTRFEKQLEEISNIEFKTKNEKESFKNSLSVSLGKENPFYNK